MRMSASCELPSHQCTPRCAPLTPASRARRFSQRKGAMIAKMKDVLVEKAGEHAIPAEVIQAEAAMAEAQQHEASEGIAL